MPKGRVLKDIPELVGTITELKKHHRDLVVPSSQMKMEIDSEPNDEGAVREFPVLQIDRDGKPESHEIQHHVNAQIATKLEIHGRYFTRMREDALDLLAVNTNYWLRRQAEEGVKRLVRLDKDGVRGFLSNSYRPIDHLDLLTTAVQVIMGKDGADSDLGQYARGARCFGWSLTPKNLNVCLVNPSYGVDLNDLDAGIQKFDMEFHEDPHGFMRARRRGDDDGTRQSHLVFPSALIRNSETGNGGLNVKAGYCEAVCMNTAWLGKDFAQVHLGKKVESEDIYSSDTWKKINQVIFAKVKDMIRNTFEPELLLENCKKFKGLQNQTVDVKEAVNAVAKLPGITEDIRDEILSNYEPLTGGTAFDFQRAVTSTAHTYRDSQPEKAWELEELGGAIIEKGMAAIKS